MPESNWKPCFRLRLRRDTHTNAQTNTQRLCFLTIPRRSQEPRSSNNVNRPLQLKFMIFFCSAISNHFTEFFLFPHTGSGQTNTAPSRSYFFRCSTSSILRLLNSIKYRRWIGLEPVTKPPPRRGTSGKRLAYTTASSAGRSFLRGGFPAHCWWPHKRSESYWSALPELPTPGQPKCLSRRRHRLPSPRRHVPIPSSRCCSALGWLKGDSIAFEHFFKAYNAQPYL